MASAASSSAAKGESVADTAKVISCYADIIAMRHPKEGAPLVAAMNASIPVINAGDGGHNHPTQTLADMLTISRELGRFDGLTVGLCGDLKFGRTVHSLIAALSRYSGIRFVLISPRELALPDVKTVHTRAEEGAVKKSPLREKFDVATSRAVAQLNALAEYCLPYVKVGGVFLAYKGGDVEEECKNAKNAVKTLGGDIRDIVSYTIPTTDITHTLVVIEKIKETADIYPRQQGKISCYRLADHLREDQLQHDVGLSLLRRYDLPLR